MPLLRFEVRGPPGDRVVAVRLARGEQVVADSGALMYCDGNIEMKTRAGSLRGFFGRALAGEGAFLNTFTGTSDADQLVTLGPAVPGDVISIALEPGEAIKLSRGAFLAGTPGVKVTGTFNAQGILGIGQQEGAVLSRVSAPEEGPAIVLASGFGVIEVHEVPAGETFVVDNERFFACASDVSYKLTSIGNVKSLLFGGEGFVMRFTGPCRVWTQTHGIAQFASVLYEYMPHRDR